MIRVFHTSGDGSGWAIDEDLRQIREGLRGVVRETSLADAQVVHSPFWMALAMHPAGVLADRFVIAHADNPPFFYLKQPEFVRAQEQVDLWVARSHEAEKQFRALGLKVVHIPYTIDPGLFFPLVKNREEKKVLRRKLGLPEEAYLIANFHRDSEGGDLHAPKLQKAPELMVMTLERLRDLGADFQVLLAGPRRHWIRGQLEEKEIAATFVGQGGIAGDDFGVNILTRPRLNELYNAADLYLVPSRWEGGPQSVMEAAACRCKILSTPVGLSRDILEPECLFRSAAEGAEILAADIREGRLAGSVEPQFRAWETNHSAPVMAKKLRELYGHLSADPVFAGRTLRRRRRFFSHLGQARHTMRRRIFPAKPPARVSLWHREGKWAELDEIITNLRGCLQRCGITVSEDPDPAGGQVLRGWSERVGEGSNIIQFVVPGGEKLPGGIPVGATVVVPSVQDVVNLRRQGCHHPVVVLPLVFEGDEESPEPLVVESGDHDASLRIWKAILAGRPVLYPAESAYYEQVFHAGLSYKNAEELAAGQKHLLRDQKDFRTLARPPERKVADRALRSLLTILSSP